jgi:hypothetical protein
MYMIYNLTLMVAVSIMSADQEIKYRGHLQRTIEKARPIHKSFNWDWSYHNLLVMHNSDNGKLVADLAAAEFVEGMSYDAQHKRLHLAGRATSKRLRWKRWTSARITT